MTAAPNRSSIPPSPSATVNRFREAVEAYYEQTFENFPVTGSLAGRHEFDATMEYPSPGLWRKQLRLVNRTLETIEDLPPQDFGPSDMLDRRAMLSELRHNLFLHEQCERWRTNPMDYVETAADAIFDPFVRSGGQLSPETAQAILARMRKLPRYLAGAAECIHRPEPIWKKQALDSVAGLKQILEDLATSITQTLGRRPSDVLRCARKAQAAADTFASDLKSIRATPAGSFAIGEPALTALIHDRLGLPYSAREVEAFANRLIGELDEAVQWEARRFDPKKTYHEILAEAAHQWQPGKNLLTVYETTVERVRQRFEEAGWISLPGNERLLLRKTPPFMRSMFPTAAYSAPGPLDPDQTGIFWVNDQSQQVRTGAQRTAELAQHFGIELTCAHEAYPGHHLQFIHQHRIPGLARKLSHHAIYYEGWTLWCEQMAADLEVTDNPYLRLIQLHDALWRAWRIVIDVGLQTGRLSCEAAARALTDHLDFTPARAEADVNWYTAAPSVPMSYMLGKMEVLRLKRRHVDTGPLSLREFNDWLLAFGAIPWRWIEASGL